MTFPAKEMSQKYWKQRVSREHSKLRKLAAALEKAKKDRQMSGDMAEEALLKYAELTSILEGILRIVSCGELSAVKRLSEAIGKF